MGPTTAQIRMMIFPRADSSFGTRIILRKMLNLSSMSLPNIP